jgi:hypothetical protein
MPTLASQIITAQFQGAINVPIFKAPYSVPPNQSSSFLMRSGAQNAYSDSSLFASGEAATADVIVSSRVTQLGLVNANVMTVGGGNNGQVVPSSLQWPSTCFDNSLITWLSNQYDIVSGQVFAGTFSSVPIFNGLNVPSVGPSARGEVTFAYGAPTTTIGVNVNSSGICLSGFLTEDAINIGGAWCMIDIETNTPPETESKLAMAFVFPIVGLTIGAILPLFGLTNTQMASLISSAQSVPNYAGASNTLVSFSTLSGFPGLYGFYYNPLPGDVGATELLQFEFDNAALNTAIVNQTYILRPCANGWLFSVGTSDYYISADWTRYWQLNFVAGAPGIPLPVAGIETGETNFSRMVTKFIDVQGIFWYTGINSNVGGTGGQNTPLYSFGFDLPFYPPVLPTIPPLKIPCWSPCSTMDSPFDSVYTD